MQVCSQRQMDLAKLMAPFIKIIGNGTGKQLISAANVWKNLQSCNFRENEKPSRAGFSTNPLFEQMPKLPPLGRKAYSFPFGKP